MDEAGVRPSSACRVSEGRISRGTRGYSSIVRERGVSDDCCRHCCRFTSSSTRHGIAAPIAVELDVAWRNYCLSEQRTKQCFGRNLLRDRSWADRDCCRYSISSRSRSFSEGWRTGSKLRVQRKGKKRGKLTISELVYRL